MRPEFKWDATRGVAMQHQLSNSNASTTIGRVKSSPTANHASERIARFAEADATCGMQFKQARNFSNAKPETRERIRLVETALRAAQRSVPHASSGVGCSDRQLSTQTPSAPPVGAQTFLSKLRIVALTSVALVLLSLVGLAVWLSVIHSPLAHQNLPSPVLTAPAFLEATAGETILLPIALDGTDGVPAHSTIAITGLPQGSTLSNGRPFGETAWKLERDEIGDLHLVLPISAGGQAKLTIQLIAPDAAVVADAEILLQVATASQDSLPRNAERSDNAGWAPANQELVLGVSPEIAGAQVLHEGAEAHAGPVLREAKPSAAATEREEDRVPLPPRVVQSQRRAPAKTTIANVGTNEIKTSVFVNLRQGPSPSAAVIRVVAKGTKLRVLARKGLWVQVTKPATSEKGWIYTGNATPPRTTKASAPSEPPEDTQPKSDFVWPTLGGVLASQ
jgi:Bacterial SH3 domain